MSGGGGDCGKGRLKSVKELERVRRPTDDFGIARVFSFPHLWRGRFRGGGFRRRLRWRFTTSGFGLDMIMTIWENIDSSAAAICREPHWKEQRWANAWLALDDSSGICLVVSAWEWHRKCVVFTADLGC